jgi:hypothetical protein
MRFAGDAAETLGDLPAGQTVMPHLPKLFCALGVPSAFRGAAAYAFQHVSSPR